MNLLSEFWSGVDVVQASVNITGARWVMHRAIVKHGFFDQEIGCLLAKLPQPYLSELQIACSAVGPRLPEVRKSVIGLLYNSSYVEVAFQVTALPGWYIGVQFLFLNMSFMPKWANPTWEALDFDPTAETEALKHRLQESVRTTPFARWHEMPFSPAELKHLVTVQPTIVQRVGFNVEQWIASYDN